MPIHITESILKYVKSPSAHQQYISYESRLRSFDVSLYPYQLRAKLASAGFIYYNYNLKCFHCDGVITDLISDSCNISDKHIKLNTNCEYAVRYMNSEIIDSIRKESFPFASAISTAQINDYNVALQTNNICSIINENLQFKKEKICIVCSVYKVSVLCLPCRHLTMCIWCKGKLKYCPKCNDYILGSVDVQD